MHKKIENDKLFSKLGSSSIFSEINSMCKTVHSDQSSVVDSATGSQQISNYFKTVYENLYNEQQEMSKQTVEKICSNVSEGKSKEVV